MNDPKYLGIPNINFSIYSDGDGRESKFKEQRLNNGFDESETWSLRDTIANFIVPRLEMYQEIANKNLARDKELVKKIYKFLEAMKLTSRDEGSFMLTDEELRIHKEGLEAFPEIFMSLWW